MSLSSKQYHLDVIEVAKISGFGAAKLFFEKLLERLTIGRSWILMQYVRNK
jgi:hypothetical protein